jgi:MscS family membrane protein
VTRIRTFAKSVITVPNAHLTTTPINNWSRMNKRRLKLTVGLSYDTTPAKLEAAVAAMRKVLEEHPEVESEGAVVNFTALGDSSLDVFVYCFCLTTEWATFLRVQQEVLLGFMRTLDALGADIAFPTQTIHIAPGGALNLTPSGQAAPFAAGASAN